MTEFAKLKVTIGQDEAAMTKVETDDGRMLMVKWGGLSLEMGERPGEGFDLVLRIPHDGYEIVGVERFPESKAKAA